MNFFGHLGTVLKHRHRVIRHCFKVGIPLQGLLHDMSKFSPSEFWLGVRYYQGDRSPNTRERELFGYSAAWMHHKGRNRHHFEYWNDVNPETKLYAPVKMPVKYLAEMFCDRVAASEIYRGKNYTRDYPLFYYRSGNAAKNMHPDTAKQLEEWLIALAERGEAEAYKKVRAALGQNKKTLQ